MSNAHAKLVCGSHGAVCQSVRDSLAVLRTRHGHEDLPDTELLHLYKVQGLVSGGTRASLRLSELQHLMA